MDAEFLDNFDHTIDAKGRLVLPSAYRHAFTEGGVVTLLGRYAALFTPDGWDRYRRRLMNETSLTRNQKQYMIGFASRFEPDAQHRVPLGRQLRETLGLEKDVTIVGSLSHAAIYPRERWHRLMSEVQERDDTGLSLNEKVDEFDFL